MAKQKFPKRIFVKENTLSNDDTFLEVLGDASEAAEVNCDVPVALYEKVEQGVVIAAAKYIRG